MPVTVAIRHAGPDTRIADVIADADADTSATIAHELGVVPDEVTITPLLVAGRTSHWIATTIDITNVIIAKTTLVGSGDTAHQVRVIIKRPHSIGR